MAASGARSPKRCYREGIPFAKRPAAPCSPSVSASSVAATCTGGTCGPTTFTDTQVNIASTSGPLLISNTAQENSNTTPGSGGLVHLSIIDNQFDVTPAPGVPEPMTTALMGGGLAALAFLRRFRRS